MKFSFDLNDKNMEYALVQLASWMGVENCQNLLVAYVSHKAANVPLEIEFQAGSGFEVILKMVLDSCSIKYAAPISLEFNNPIGEVSRKHLKEAGAALLPIQEHLELSIAAYSNELAAVFVSNGLATWGRSTSFIRDDKFMSLVDKHSGLLPIPNWHWNLSVALWCAKTALRLNGDFVELGVFKGHTTLFLAEYLNFSAIDKHWYLYDTFTGIPTEDLNNESWIEKNKGVYVNTYSYEEVKERFNAYSNIHVVQGRVPDIFTETPPPSKIAFLHVDLNSARAEVAALDAIYDSMVTGGIILFDDYGWAVCGEQHQAINEWARENMASILELPTGQGLMVVTR